MLPFPFCSHVLFRLCYTAEKARPPSGPKTIQERNPSSVSPVRYQYGLWWCLVPSSALPAMAWFYPAQAAKGFSRTLSFTFLGLLSIASEGGKVKKRMRKRKRNMEKRKRKAVQNIEDIFTELFTANRPANFVKVVFTRERKFSSDLTSWHDFAFTSV